MVKRIKRKHMLLIILVAYVIAYLLVTGVENYRVNNEYEQAKKEYYYKEWLKNEYEQGRFRPYTK